MSLTIENISRNITSKLDGDSRQYHLGAYLLLTRHGTA
jgi:hypothetical protein